MAGSYKIFKTLLLLFGLFQAGSPQFIPDTFPFISQNFCVTQQGFTPDDNFSCIEDGIEGVACFSRTLLCNGVEDCPNGADEGASDAFSSLTCAGAASQFNCGDGNMISFTGLCNGVADCPGLNAAFGAADENAAICDNKCLAPFYGTCSESRRCLNSRLGVNCGTCFQGVDAPGQDECGSFFLANVTVTEGDAGTNPLSVCGTLTYNINQALNVAFDISIAPGSTATQNSDFTLQTSTLSFSSPFTGPANTFEVVVLTECVLVNIIDDIETEPTESFIIQATQSNLTGAVIFLRTGQVNIIDNDLPQFGFTAAGYTGTESVGGVINALVQINNGVTIPAGSSVSVTCSPSPISAAAGADYNPTPITLVFTSTSTTLPCPIPIVNDNIIENTETFQLQLTVAAGQGTVSPPSSMATGTIFDSTPQFGFNPTDYTEIERDGQASVTIVELNGQSFAAGVTRLLSVSSNQISASGVANSGLDGDFVNVFNQQVEIGSPTIQFFYTLIDDTSNEMTETFQLLLSSADGLSIVPGATGTANIEIQDNDLTLFQFTENPISVTEGDGTVQVCVELAAGSPSGTVSLVLDPSPGTAVSPTDFVDTSMTIFFGANSPVGTTVCTNFGIGDDNDIENLENFLVTASGGAFVGGANSVQINIADNDNAVFAFTLAEFNSGEATTPAVATIQLISNVVLAAPITIFCSTLNSGSAMGGSVDFTNVFNQQLVFPAGSGQFATQDCAVPVNNDGLVEVQEDIDIMAMIQGAAGTFSGGGNSAQAQINIIDDDVVIVGFQQQDYTMTEDLGDQMVCLNTSSMIGPGVTVTAAFSTQVASVAGKPSATSGMDFATAPSVALATFSQGVFLQCTVLDIIPDSFDEPNEVFLVVAAPQSGQISIPDPSSTVCITDDDLIVVEFDMPRYTVSEGGPAVQICVAITEGFVGSAPLIINVASVAGGTAELGADFTTINQDLIFPPSSVIDAQECFFFLPSPDQCVEDPEDIIIQASSTVSDVQFTASGNQAGIYIEDDDTIPVMIVPPAGSTAPFFNVNEDAGPVQVCVQAVAAVGVLKRAVSVKLTTEDGTAIGTGTSAVSDFCSEDVTFTFQPGQAGDMLCVDIDIINDNICEGSENFGLLLAPCPDGGTTIVNSMGSVTIFDDDVANITAEYDVSIPENIGMFKIHVILLGEKAPGRSCLVTASTMDGTAVSTGLNPDFVGLVETVTLDSADQVQYIELEILDDGICEGTESFQVFLSTNSPGCAIEDGVSPIEVTIVDDEIGGGGDDPHFSIVLPSGKLLCYTVQGEHGFSFNLISNKKMTMNARFVPDSRRSEVTWMGSMGIIVRDNSYKQSNATALRFEALEKKIYIGDKVELAAKNIERMIFKNGKLTLSEAPPTDNFKYPSIYVDLQDVEITFTMKFLSEHLDIFWHRTGGKIPDSHGIIGQFFRTGVEIDEVRKILIMPNKEPVPVMRRPVWSFMEREKDDDQLCWTAMNPGYQGEGLIDGTYYDYLVDDVMTSEYEFKKQ